MIKIHFMKLSTNKMRKIHKMTTKTRGGVGVQLRIILALHLRLWVGQPTLQNKCLNSSEMNQYKAKVKTRGGASVSWGRWKRSR